MTEYSDTEAVQVDYRRWFGPDHAEELRRHGRLSEIYDPASIKALSQIGIGTRWHCLDAGCGRGTIAAWLADRAYEGTTIACDADDFAFPAQAPTALRPMKCDIRAAGFAAATFDLIHARLLLQHLPDREQVLDQLVSWLAPGGWLVVADAFDLASTSTSHPDYAAFHHQLYRKMTAQSDTLPDWGRHYPEPLIRRGLTEIALNVVTVPVHGGDAYARLLHESLDRTRPDLLGLGLTQDALDAVLAELRDPEFWDLGFALVIARGRKAPGPERP
jgi:SAM-dependent methyltransferase